VKIRNGFVSNSSTTSFSIFGVILKDKNLKTIRSFLEKNINIGIEKKIKGCKHEYDKESKFCPECGKPALINNPDWWDKDEIELYSEIAEFYAIELNVRNSEESYFVGILPEQLEDNKTLLESKKELVDSLNNRYGTKFYTKDVQFYSGTTQC